MALFGAGCLASANTTNTISSFQLQLHSTEASTSSSNRPALYGKERQWRKLDAPWRDIPEAQQDKPEGAGNSPPQSSGVGVRTTLKIEDKLPETLKIATRLGRLDAGRRFAPLRDARGARWDIVRHHLETTFDVRLPPNLTIAWVAVQAAMGLKGLRFSHNNINVQSQHLTTQDALGLGRLDCGMERSFESAKKARFTINFLYEPDNNYLQDITSLFRFLIQRCATPGTPDLNPTVLVDWLEWQPIFWPAGVVNFVDTEKLGLLINTCRDMSERENKGVVLMLPVLQFVSEILWRCCYIFESFRAMAPSGGLGLNLLGEPVEGLIDFARKGRCYWPCLGPNIALDAFIFEQGILRENEPFDPQTSYLVRMYGMGIRDLRFLQRNPNELERREQLDTLHRCHTLRSWLGREHSADLTEQLEFCYFSMAASMKHHIVRSQRYCPPGMEDHPQRVKARQREFKILKIMVDRIWQETERNEGRRRAPILLRRKCYAGTGETIREGDWHLLETEEKHRLLGERSQYHAQHPEHTRLLRQWLPTLVGSNPNCLLKFDKDLNQGLPLAPATPAPRCCCPCTCRGSGKNPAPDSALTTWMRVESFINNKCKGAIHHAPNGLEEFMEISDPSVLEKKDPPPAEVQQAELFSPRPKTAFDELVEQEKHKMGL